MMREPITIGNLQLTPRDLYVLSDPKAGGIRVLIKDHDTSGLWRCKVHKFAGEEAWYLVDGVRTDLPIDESLVTITGNNPTEATLELGGAIRYLEDYNGLVTEILDWGTRDFYGRAEDNNIEYAFYNNQRLRKMPPSRKGMFDKVNRILYSLSGGPHLHIPERFFEGCVAAVRVTPDNDRPNTPFQWHDGTVGDYMCCNINAPTEDLDLTNFYHFCGNPNIGKLNGSFMNLKARNIIADYVFSMSQLVMALGDDMFNGMECENFKAYAILMFVTNEGIGNRWFANTKGNLDLSGAFQHYAGPHIGENMFQGSTANVNLTEFLYYSSINQIAESTFRGLTKITAVDKMFTFTSQLKTVPLLFDRNEAINSIKNIFMHSGVESVPDTFFDNFPNVTDCTAAFQYCFSLTDAPKLWQKFPGATGKGCYAGCTSLPWYDEIPTDWKS